MAQTITEIVVLLDPTKSGDSRLTAMIELAELNLSEDVFGDHYNQAVALLVLHLYEMSSRTGSGGAITSEKEGQLSRSFAAVASAIAWGSTSWGQELIHLTQSLNVFPRTRMMT